MRGSTNKPKWILASASPRRSEILARLGVEFLVDPSGISEPPRKPQETPASYVVRIARLKARETARRHASGLILAADTIVVVRDKILGKPETREEARSMLKSLSGRWHEVLTAVCLLDIKSKKIRSICIRSRVHFRRLSASDIDWYLRTGEYKDKAGAYGVQGFASLWIDRIEGCYFNIVGFPIAAFEKLCRKSGIRLVVKGLGIRG